MKKNNFEIYASHRKFCNDCGNHNQLVPFMFLGNQRHDSRTGKPIMHFICVNTGCLGGAVEMKQQKIDSCKDHKDGPGFFELFNPLYYINGDKCKNCGQPSYADEGMGWS